MDGYASDSSSMVQDGVKVSLYNACPQALILDTDILAKAPMHCCRRGWGTCWPSTAPSASGGWQRW